MNKILQPLVDELNQLYETGVTINRIDKREIIKGALVAFLADNLASHAVGGFKQSMSFAKHFCRTCLATKDESCRKFTSKEFELRTPPKYERMCAEIAIDTTNTKSIDYGINERSILNDVKEFSVIGGLCHDVFHDLLEGTLSYELKLLLKHFFAKKYLTLSQYNDLIKSFNYGYSETTNKPNDIPARVFAENLKLRYSASEMLLIVHIFPFIVGDKVPNDDPNYLCYLKLIEVLQIALSTSLSERRCVISSCIN